MPYVERDREVKRRRNKKKKVTAIKARLQTERDTKIRMRLIARLKKISPNTPAPEK